jgi:queuine tRNA-ribosyltransferase
LFLADEMLGPILLTHHNLTYYQRLLSGVRLAIEQERFGHYADQKMRGWRTPGQA